MERPSENITDPGSYLQHAKQAGLFSLAKDGRNLNAFSTAQCSVLISSGWEVKYTTLSVVLFCAESVCWELGLYTALWVHTLISEHEEGGACISPLRKFI